MNAEKYFSNPELAELAREQFVTVEDCAKALEASYLSRPGAPDLIVVAG